MIADPRSARDSTTDSIPSSEAKIFPTSGPTRELLRFTSSDTDSSKSRRSPSLSPAIISATSGDAMEKSTSEIANDELRFLEIVREFVKKGLTADQAKEVVADILVSEVMES